MGVSLRGLAIAVLPVACTTGVLNDNGTGVFGSASASATASEGSAGTANDSGSDEVESDTASGSQSESADATASEADDDDTADASADGPTGDPETEDSGSESEAAVCGDDNLQAGEDCDGMELGDASCAALGFDDGIIACDPECHVITDACFTCGDGEIALTEVCDGLNFDGETCASLGFLGGALSCAPDCSELVTSQCQPLPSCGDGERNGGEQCDGDDFGAATCVSQGFDLGNLACSESCTIDTSGCMDDLENCGMMGDFCFFDKDDLQSTCCPAGVGGNVLGICDIFVCV